MPKQPDQPGPFPSFDPPPEMRDFALRSVEQAKRAFDGFMGAAKGAHTVQENAVEATVQAVSFAEQNVKAALDHAQKLVQAQGLQEVAELQSAFMRAQFEALQAQMTSVAEGLTGKKR